MEVLPCDIWLLIFSFLDRLTLKFVYLISREFKGTFDSREYENILKKLITRDLSLITDNYTRPQINFMCSVRNEKYLYAQKEAFVINVLGEVYTMKQQSLPTLIPGLSNIIQIASKGLRTLALDRNGILYFVGETLIVVEGLIGIVKIISDQYVEDNKKNIYIITHENGQVKFNITHDLFIFDRYHEFETADFRVKRDTGTLALLTDGCLYTLNYQRGLVKLALQQGNFIDIVTINPRMTLVLSNEGKIYTTLFIPIFQDNHLLTLIREISDIIEIDACVITGDIMALDRFGRVYYFKTNDLGQLILEGKNFEGVLIPNFKVF